MKHAFIFPGQGSQFSGMGKTLYNQNPLAKEIFEQANEILNFDISSIMFEGTEEQLKQTNITQPAVFIHSVAAFKTTGKTPDMVAGHSLGEFSALVANKTLSFKDALILVSIRAAAMQKACEKNPSTMAAIIGLGDEIVEDICKEINNSGEVCVAANYNCPGQLVISGTIRGIEEACIKMKSAGAKRALPLPVGGAFHSPLMLPAKEELSNAIEGIIFNNPVCPVYQNISAQPVTDPKKIKENLIAQLTGPVLWTQCVQSMINDGSTHFTECGPGKVLQGLVQKVSRDILTDGIS